MNPERIELDGNYLIVAPKPEPGMGYYHSVTERAFLVDNILNFLKNHPEIKSHQITVYELRQLTGFEPQENQMNQSIDVKFRRYKSGDWEPSLFETTLSDDQPLPRTGEYVSVPTQDGYVGGIVREISWSYEKYSDTVVYVEIEEK